MAGGSGSGRKEGGWKSWVEIASERSFESCLEVVVSVLVGAGALSGKEPLLLLDVSALAAILRAIRETATCGEMCSGSRREDWELTGFGRTGFAARFREVQLGP